MNSKLRLGYADFPRRFGRRGNHHVLANLQLVSGDVSGTSSSLVTALNPVDVRSSLQKTGRHPCTTSWQRKRIFSKGGSPQSSSADGSCLRMVRPIIMQEHSLISAVVLQMFIAVINEVSQRISSWQCLTVRILPLPRSKKESDKSRSSYEKLNPSPRMSAGLTD